MNMGNGAAWGRSRGQVGAVPAVDRALRILQTLAAAPLRLTEIARRLGLPKSTTLAILRTLRRRRIVAYDPTSARYAVGSGLIALAGGAHAQRDLRRAARPVVERLARATHETVILHLPDDSGSVVADSEESRHQLRVAAPPGYRLPPFAGAVAKVMLAALPEREAAQRIPRTLPRFTPRSITSRATYLRELRRVRIRGYAADDEEYLPGVRAVSAPIAGPDGRLLATLSVVGVKTRLSAARAAGFAPLVRQAAGEISRGLAVEMEPADGRATHG